MRKYRAVYAAVLIAVAALVGCSLRSHTEPEITVNNAEILGQGIFINPNAFKPYGVTTLFINEDDSVDLVVQSSLLKTPNYVWKPADESILKVVPTPNDPKRSAIAIAVGDSGATTKLTLNDVGNQAVKTIDVKIVKHWADPDFYKFIGSYGGHYYYISKDLKTWQQAVVACKEAGGYLVAINSAQENALLQKAMARLDSVWIGLRLRNENENKTDANGNPLPPKWTLKYWENGEPVTYENFAEKSTDPGIFFEIFYFMDRSGRWANWHEQPHEYFLEME
ncbi:MAG: C-type lectin domain-containing protein [candidate division KSB1 bacterium]|nr:C-type lectin domain-containing protein [candidate division KSB1 bacterium]